GGRGLEPAGRAVADPRVLKRPRVLRPAEGSPFAGAFTHVKEMVMHDPTQQFRQFLQQREAVANAYVCGDTGPLEKIATQQEPATSFGPGGGTDQGVDAVSAATAEGAKHFRPGGVSRLEILHAQASGELAYWVGLQHALVHSPDRPSPVEMSLRVTE